MNRHNTFLLFHKGLRAMMYDMGLKIQHADFANYDETLVLLAALEELLATFEAHAQQEDTYLLPLVEKHNPKLFDEFAAEHVKDKELSDNLSELIAAYKKADPTSRYQIGYQLFYMFNEFIAFNLSHLNKEENELNKAIWQFYTDDQIMEVQRRLIASNTPKHMEVGAYWMLKGCNNMELSYWLKEVKRSAPQPAFEGRIHLAKSILPAKRWEDLQKALA